MASLDDRVQEAQDKVINFYVDNEPQISEYITVPLFHTYIFLGTDAKLIRAICIFILIMRQILIKGILPERPFINFFLIAPLFAYAATIDTFIAPLIYALTYSPNLYEGAFVAANSTFLNSYYSFESAYLFHILYIALRNHIVVEFLPANKTHLLTINIKTHENIYLHERARKAFMLVESLLINSLGLTE